MIYLRKALTRNKKKHITFLYIPENESSIKALRITTAIPKIIIGVLASIIIYAISYTVAYNNLKLEYEASIANIKNITAINNAQKIEIEKLEENAQKIQEQLCENINTLEEVKTAVGIKDKKPSTNDSIDIASDMDSSSVNISFAEPIFPKVNENDVDYSDHLKLLQTSFISLTKEALSQKTAIDESIVSIKNRLSLLRATPSILPVRGRIGPGYGYRKNPFTGRGSEFHKGVDIGAKTGTPVVATADGVVTFAGRNAGYGNMVIISHGYGFVTSYSHNSQILVKQGDRVKRGQVISKVGSTGRSTAPHVHYEVKVNGKNVDPSKYY